MAKELYLYSPIYDFVIEDLLSKMEENSNEDVVMRINSPGGQVLSGWGLIAKMQERAKQGLQTDVKLDGAAMSMAAMILLFADTVEALDVSTVMLHRASMYVSNEQDQAFLDSVNKSLRSKMEAKIDGKLLKELKGVSIKDLFEAPERVDVFLTAAEAKKLGIVNKINKINPKEIEAFNERFYSIAAIAEPKPLNNQNQKIMKIEELKANHPALFAEVVALGVSEERDRVGACLAFLEIDAQGVKKAIESGKPLSQTQMAEFTLKAVSAKKIECIQEDSTKTPVQTNEQGGAAKSAEETQKEVKMSAFTEEVNAFLGRNKK